MEIPKIYAPQEVEKKWYQYWTEKKYFHSEPDQREPYTIVIPPPNVTGVLHMGHMLNSTIQDVLIRRARMLGKNACWIPGTDHASIATEAKVVQKLREQGIKKSDLSREEFLQHAFDWKEKHGDIILEQLKKIGASCDWERTNFTMNPDYSDSVINVFIDLYYKGKIYRGVRMVNWDPEAKTALSDEEVIHKEVNSKLFYIRYKIVESRDEWITIATTRPETILGDTAICVHPDDPRYKHLIGKEAVVPVANRNIPIISDPYVDPTFGTGCLKITPAHDTNDYAIGQRHKLQTIDIFHENATLNEHGLHYEGMDRFVARKKIEQELNDTGYLVKTEDIINKIGFSERTDAIIEPKLSLQWFVKMTELAQPAIENVQNGTIRFFPEKFKNTYQYWMENIKDWCVSRQLWWGHRIPAWYFGQGIDDFVIAKTKQEALILANKKSGKKIDETDIYQDEDVLDTWFSSWLWPISVFNGITYPDNAEIAYYYPTNDLVTAPEILFFWVARMIMSGYEYMGILPFKNVYYTGIVRDKLGRKMSKSLGNSPDPIQLIEKYSADGVRMGILLSSPAGNDLPFDSTQCEQGRNFVNKIWNAFRLIKGWEIQPIEQAQAAKQANIWFDNRLNETVSLVNQLFEEFKMSEALMAIYKLVWDDFCSWYLELVKPQYQQPIDENTYEQTNYFFEQILKLLHPFMPFVTEELWHLIGERKPNEDLIISQWPKTTDYTPSILHAFKHTQEVITKLRNLRTSNQIAQKIKIELLVKKNNFIDSQWDSALIKMGNLSELRYVADKITHAGSFIVANNEYYVPLADRIDIEAEILKLKQELLQANKLLESVRKKLGNEKFMHSAPSGIIEKEKEKENGSLSKIQIIEEKLQELEQNQYK